MDPPERPSLFTHPGQCLVTQLARELEQGLLAGGSFCTESEMTDGDITPDHYVSSSTNQSNQSPRSTVVHRVAVVGARGVGKSMLINKVSEQMRADESATATTSGSSYRVVSVVVPAFSFPSSKRVMTLMDTPACSDSPKEDPGSQLPLQIKIKVNGEVDVVLVCIDLTDPAALMSTQTLVAFWKKQDFAVALVGTKHDQADSQLLQEIHSWLPEIRCPFFVTSAKDGHGIGGAQQPNSATPLAAPSSEAKPAASQSANSSVRSDAMLPTYTDSEEGCSCKACVVQ